MADSISGKDSVTEVAEESFVRERPLEIQRGAVLAGRYQVEEIIGKGGSGVVLRVFDRTVQSVVALKVLKSELARDAKWDKRFSRELRLGRPIQHPNVCRIFDIGEADGHRFLTMELATGGSLRDELKRRPALERPLSDRIADAKAAIAGLAAIHEAGVVHRDFKPDNLLRMEDGRLVISDFGLATDAATAAGVTVMIGTPHYMAPEVLAGEPATTRSDVWALGVVLHEIMFGRRPERKAVSFEGTAKANTAPPGRVERAVLALLERCLEESSGIRPANATVVSAEFDAALSRGWSARRGRWPRSAVGVAAAALLAGALVVSVSKVLRWKAGSARPSGERSKIVAADPGPDWGASARRLADLPGPVHCFEVLDAQTARVIWGWPRVAEDIRWADGRRSPSSLDESTFAVGCPVLAPDRRRLLFTSHSASGTSEIRLSDRPDGRESTVITAGANPLWINDEEFVLDIDLAHVAMFSLASREIALMAADSVSGGFAIGDKSVGPDGNTIAVLYVRGADRAIAVFDAHRLTDEAVLDVPGASKVQFDQRADQLLVSYQSASEVSGVIALRWQDRTARGLGRYRPFDMSFVSRVGSHLWAVARRVRSDAWVQDDPAPRRLTSDGQTYTVSARASGELLVSRRDDKGQMNVWALSPAGDSRRLTNGPVDVAPAFSPIGSRWAYADYAHGAILLCEDLKGTPCRVIYRSDAVPTGPRFSPDGSSLSVVTQLRTPRVAVVSVPDGKIRGSWDSVRQCPPVWSDEGTIWSLEVASAGLRWTERSISGERTGRSAASPANPSPAECWPRGVSGPASLRRAWTSTLESSSLLDVP
ncbi:MAG TPA: serine/threonine-protein kinase [Polyangia bacterium]|nr:serine/threonine-protein kinase [Polyangia bacterium]